MHVHLPCMWSELVALSSTYRFFFSASRRSPPHHEYPIRGRELRLREVKEHSQGHIAQPRFTYSFRIHWLNFFSVSGWVFGTHTAANESGPHFKTLVGYWVHWHLLVIAPIVQVPDKSLCVWAGRGFPRPFHCLLEWTALSLVGRAELAKQRAYCPFFSHPPLGSAGYRFPNLSQNSILSFLWLFVI